MKKKNLVYRGKSKDVFKITKVPVMTILNPENAVLAIERILH